MSTPISQNSDQTLIFQDKAFGPGISLRLPIFEGPMDLLLYLIRREEMDIFDIPIARITHEYLQSLELMRAYDLDVGGEFLSLAATLLQIKARLLLPRPETGNPAEDEDPRRDLVTRLLEYKAFKESAALFRNMEITQSELFWRNLPPLPDDPAPEEALRDVSLFDLLTAFKRAMDRLKDEKPHYNVFLLPETLDQRLTFLRAQLQGKKRLSFSELIQDLQTRLALILTFLAILELVRIGEIALRGISEEDFFLYPKSLKQSA